MAHLLLTILLTLSLHVCCKPSAESKCSREGWGPKQNTFHFQGIRRPYVAYVPPYAGELQPFWLVLPGAGQDSWGILTYSGIKEYAKQKGFAYLAVEGTGEDR